MGCRPVWLRYRPFSSCIIHTASGSVSMAAVSAAQHIPSQTKVTFENEIKGSANQGYMYDARDRERERDRGHGGGSRLIILNKCMHMR